MERIKLVCEVQNMPETSSWSKGCGARSFGDATETWRREGIGSGRCTFGARKGERGEVLRCEACETKAGELRGEGEHLGKR
jgi:hypothetical protein